MNTSLLEAITYNNLCFIAIPSKQKYAWVKLKSDKATLSQFCTPYVYQTRP